MRHTDAQESKQSTGEERQVPRLAVEGQNRRVPPPAKLPAGAHHQCQKK
jgi:hypothetical protein